MPGGATEAGGRGRAEAVLSHPFVPWLVVFALVAGVLLLGAYRIAEPVAGYHGFNEGFYLDLGQRYADAGFLGPLVSPLDLDNPPLYPMLLGLVFKVFGFGVVQGRLLGLALTGAMVVVVFLIGRRIYTEEVGLVAAACFAFMPGVVLIGRNVQTDMLFVLLGSIGVLLYLNAVKGEDVRLAALAGAVLGLSVLVKLPAIMTPLVLVVWRTWRDGSLSWLRLKSTWAVVAAFVVVGVPWYVRMVFAPGGFLAEQGRLAGVAAGGGVTRDFLTRLVLPEIVGLVTPLLAAVALYGLWVVLTKRQPAHKLVAGGVAVWLGFYFAMHAHTYYLLPMAPYLALACGRGFRGLGVRARTPAVVVALCVAVVLAFSTGVTLSAKKWGHWSPAYLASDLERIVGGSENVVVHVDPDIPGNSFGPIWEHDIGSVKWVSGISAPESRADTRTLDVIMARVQPAPGPEIGYPTMKRHRLVLFGYAFDASPGRAHLLAGGEFRSVRVGGPLTFGMDTVTMRHPAWAYFVYPPEAAP